MADKKEHPKVLITGASGLVGTYVTPILANKYSSIYVTCHEQAPLKGTVVQIDLSNTIQLNDLLEEIRPDIIVNLAALTDVDRCEFDINMAALLNRDLVAALARYTSRNKGSYLLHVSTDYVFDGKEGNYIEESTTNPINLYGKTKLEGENKIVRNLDASNWCIVRTSTPFGIHPKKISFPLFVINKMRNNESIKVLFDQFTSPTYALNLGVILDEIIGMRLTGIFHIAGRSTLSRYEQALKLADAFDLDEGLIVKTSMQDMDWKAKRPQNSSLNVDKAIRVLRNTPQNFDEALTDLDGELSNL